MMEPAVLERWRAAVTERLAAFRKREALAIEQMQIAAAMGMGAWDAAEHVRQRMQLVQQWCHDNKHQYLFS